MVSGPICLANGSISLCAPAVFPWYLLWLLPFLTSASTLLIIVWTVSIIPTYVQWHLRALGRPWGSASWLGNAAGIRMRGSSGCNYRISPGHAACSARPAQRRRVRCTAGQPANFMYPEPPAVIIQTQPSVQFTEERTL